jgi:hypothetical protein
LNFEPLQSSIEPFERPKAIKLRVSALNRRSSTEAVLSCKSMVHEKAKEITFYGT